MKYRETGDIFGVSDRPARAVVKPENYFSHTLCKKRKGTVLTHSLSLPAVQHTHSPSKKYCASWSFTLNKMRNLQCCILLIKLPRLPTKNIGFKVSK